MLIIPISLATTTTHQQDMSEISKYDNGSTVFAGDNIIDKNKINKYPIVSNLESLFTQIRNGEFEDAFFSIATGAVPTPQSEILVGNVSNEGIVEGFEGPGYVTVDKDKITVNPPGEFVWGYNSPYTQAKIVPDGIDIINNKTNQTVGHIDPKTMTNDTIPGDMVNVETLKYWYNHYGQGSKYNLEFCVAGINDNRTYISPKELKEHFPEAYNYSIKYPGGSPVIIYGQNYTETKVASTYTYLDSHPQYNDRNREYNAKQFVKAWNDTIIPSNARSSGRDGIGFSAVPESKAESGMATHGVCPPARSLRNAVLSLGFALPIGMDSGRDAVLYGFSPSTGIKVNNTLDYPIKIQMWTEGSGAGMRIYTNIYELIPNDHIKNSTNSTNNTDSTNTTNN
ncbi:hypothetical protein [Methanobrevibacter olleyae]|uniref:Uncharacterized protein n=1 Tax=Methanobrevibacter olleyae TaxID=294671 RepID=A0A126R0Z9_METOL|nr:hypothetical protein [Methanobrevibacter olleyae]AMK15305.1 hypothetical protein YLM1_0748 [Methanobrevibacter olleyae]SFL29704.1 hypothetical protein SAMN02910297_00494 [Methanobrevibacter olleyae]